MKKTIRMRVYDDGGKLLYHLKGEYQGHLPKAEIDWLEQTGIVVSGRTNLRNLDNVQRHLYDCAINQGDGNLEGYVFETIPVMPEVKPLPVLEGISPEQSEQILVLRGKPEYADLRAGTDH
jgi:hypothetical protein